LADSVAGSLFEGGKGDDLVFYMLKEASYKNHNQKISLNKLLLIF